MTIRRAHLESGEPRRPGKIVFRKIMPSELNGKNHVIEEMVAALKAVGFLADENNALRARLCFDEALVNAIRHGNGYDPAKQVTVTVSATRAKWNILVEDQGNGFRESDVPDPDDPASRLMEGGRGILILRSFLSRSTHFRGGSALLMEKYERPSRHFRDRKATGAHPQGEP